MKLKYLNLVIMLVVVQTSFSQNKSIMYFDESWEETDKENASFYRPLPLEEKEGNVLVKDYYMSGKLQYVGWESKDEEASRTGEVKWFFENGNIASIRNYKNGVLDGIRKTFYEDGTAKVVINYKDGKRVGEESYFNKDANILHQGINRDNEPYEGTFFKISRAVKYTSTYKTGLIIQEDILFPNKTELKGTYKKGKPYQGRFISDAEVHGWYCKKISTLVNGKEEGQQIFKRIKDTEPYAYYYAKNGLKDGEYYDYDKDDDTTYIMQYKNGKPIEGKLLDEDGNIFIYKNGTLDVTKESIEGRGFNYFEIYKNNEKVGVEYNLFEIDGENKQTGIYKKGKPYQGYFLKGGVYDSFEFPILDYYEKGKKKYQYAHGYNKMEDAGPNYEKITIPFKSVYKNNEIYTGAKYYPRTKDPVITTKILNKGKVEAFSIWVFAMHYGNNLIAKRTKEGLILQEIQAPDLKIKIDDKYISLLYQDSLLISQREKKGNDLKNKVVLYYLEDNVLKNKPNWCLSEKAYKIVEDNDIGNVFDRSDFLVQMYSKIPVEDAAEFILNTFPDDNFFEEENFITRMAYNEFGKPFFGILINENNNMFDAKVYFNGELKASKSKLTIQALKLYIKEQNEYLGNMYEESSDFEE